MVDFDLQDVLVGIFAPLLILSSCAVYRYGRLLIDIIRHNNFNMRAHSLWVVIVLLFSGLLWETIFYGSARAISQAHDVKQYLALTMRVEFAMVPKLLYAVAAGVSVATYSLLVGGQNRMRLIFGLSLLAWLLATISSAVLL